MSKCLTVCLTNSQTEEILTQYVLFGIVMLREGNILQHFLSFHGLNYIVTQKPVICSLPSLNKKDTYSYKLLHDEFVPEYLVALLEQLCVLPVCSPFILESSANMVYLQSKRKYQSSCCFTVTPFTLHPYVLTATYTESATPVPKIDKRADNQVYDETVQRQDNYLEAGLGCPEACQSGRIYCCVTVWKNWNNNDVMGEGAQHKQGKRERVRKTNKTKETGNTDSRTNDCAQGGRQDADVTWSQILRSLTRDFTFTLTIVRKWKVSYCYCYCFDLLRVSML